MAFVKRSAVTALGNQAMNDNLPNRAIIQRQRQADANGNPNDDGIEADAITKALHAVTGQARKKKQVAV